MFEKAPAVRPFLLATILAGLGFYLFFGGLALVEVRAAATWGLVLVPLAWLFFAAAGFEATRVVRSLKR
jgi:hypothetical protein